ncbi:hypothetical protein ACL02U_13460 [Streptomyces sp. MS06]|uniref:hypothetical protein n=1 Tax=Streptomyces sp. MS06 TaxID=3385974 RepID=UPI00399F6A29
MLVLGLLLLAGTAGFTALAIVGNLSGGPEYTVSVLGSDIATMNGLALFSSGLALALIFCLGLALVTAGTVHHRRRTGRGRGRHGRSGTGRLDGMPGRPEHHN